MPDPDALSPRFAAVGGRAEGEPPHPIHLMSYPRSRVSDRHLDVLRAETQLTLPALSNALEAQLEAKPELGLFLVSEPGLIRLSGLDLHGDILIRASHPESAEALLVAHRQGDRRVLDALMAATAASWTVSSRAPSTAEGLGLLNLAQYDVVLGPYERIEFSDRAQEDAFCCREFAALAAMRRKLAELNERASRPHDLVGILWEEYNYKDILAEVDTPHTILHRGEKLVLCLRKRISTRKGSSLTIHFTLRPERRACVIGALTERRRA